MLEVFERVFMLIAMLVVVAGLGSTQTLASLRSIASAPYAVSVGMAVQFGLMPLIAYGLAKGLGLSPGVAIGVILLGCAPGGLTSNILTYFARGNIGLSIMMTMASTLAAVVMMPFLTWLYGNSYSHGALTIPYGALFGSLVLMLVPLALGMLVRARRPAWAPGFERAGSITGVLVIVYLIASWFPKHGGMAVELDAAVLLAPFLFPFLGYGLGYVAARALRLNVADSRAVSLEAGTQNSVLTIAIITLSFPASVTPELVTPALLYQLFAMLVSLPATLWMRARHIEMA